MGVLQNVQQLVVDLLAHEAALEGRAIGAVSRHLSLAGKVTFTGSRETRASACRTL
jgi:hypothetical protein